MKLERDDFKALLIIFNATSIQGKDIEFAAQLKKKIQNGISETGNKTTKQPK